MPNPFYVAPPDIGNSLQQLIQGVQQGRVNAARQDAANTFAQGGDTRGALAKLIGMGDVQLAQTIGSFGNNERDFAFRQQESQRAQGNADRGFGLQEKQINATAGNTAASQALARAQFEFLKEQGNRPEIRDVNGVPMFVDRKGGQATAIGGMPAIPGNIPPGVDPATYRREQAQAAVKSETENRDLAEGGKGVLAMVDQLEKKISDPTNPQVAQKFGSATGPFVGAASDASTWDPRKWAYEGVQSRDSKAYLDRIKQDAQAINSTMQRALLKGGGAISDSERASINQILGAIAQSRSPEDAQALLDNFRGIVRQMFKMPAETSSPAAQAAGGLPPLPPGFVVQQ